MNPLKDNVDSKPKLSELEENDMYFSIRAGDTQQKELELLVYKFYSGC